MYGQQNIQKKVQYISLVHSHRYEKRVNAVDMITLFGTLISPDDA